MDREKVKAFVRRSIRAGYYISDPDYDFQEYVMKLITGCST